MSDKYNDHLKAILAVDTRLVDEQGDLMLNKIKDFANSLDETLLDILLADEESRDKFFIKIKEIFVFKQRDFIFFLEQNSLDNSFTSFANRIGLTLNGKFLKDNTDVVLDFPYKDCVLEGGQSTEEGTDVYFECDDKTEEYKEAKSKRKEIFYNNIIAKDEIDRLFEPKAFENILRYEQDGESVPTEFKRDENGNVKDNLIIKGNNLLALHSLQQEFKGKVKLIYIDPPYNTGNDDFKYNDSFNHSTWLTFMKNRLSVARDLLSPEGSIFISIDNKELSYLQIVLNDVFGQQFYRNLITVKRSAISGPKVINPGVVNISEYLLVYSKSSDWKFNRAYSRRNRDPRYNVFIENASEKFEKWTFIPLLEAFSKYHGKDLRTLKREFAEALEDEIDDFVLKNIESVVQYANLDENSVSAKAIEYKRESQKNPSIIFCLKREGKDSYFIHKGKVILFYKDRIRYVDGKLSPSEPVSDIWTDVLPNDLHNEGGVDFRKGKKPEKLIARIIEIGSNEKDIILDYHLGSGTTAAVAHKLNRQYIGIEQMNYGDNDSVNRMKNVVSGKDDRGISRMVNWEGGGSFMYMELAKNNQKAIELIRAVENFKELQNLFTELYDKYFLHYNVKIQEFKNKIIKEENFLQLPLDKQKEMFIRMLDNNQLYVNVDDMEDTRYGLDPADIRLTKDFYQINE